mmetsp:Transcript_68071/g.219979  ORF Transcript_68071/g.219979 Transcript_68071/m.219979 type:complete len:207 (+) Transcript_68071:1228-1848(+)
MPSASCCICREPLGTSSSLVEPLSSASLSSAAFMRLTARGQIISVVAMLLANIERIQVKAMTRPSSTVGFTLLAFISRSSARRRGSPTFSKATSTRKAPKKSAEILFQYASMTTCPPVMSRKGSNTMGTRAVAKSGITSKTQKQAQRSVRPSMSFALGYSSMNWPKLQVICKITPSKNPISCCGFHMPIQHGRFASWSWMLGIDAA